MSEEGDAASPGNCRLPRRVFVSEFVCGGGWPHGCPEGSLRTEGAAMLLAVVDDFSHLTGVTVATTWDRRLGAFPLASPSIEVHAPASRFDESALFDRLVSSCDATLVIAPEFHGTLERRTARVIDVGGRSLGPSPSIARLCGDKRALAAHLCSAGVAAIPTAPVPERPSWSELPFPIVVKPRCGAGSVNTRLATTAAELEAILKASHDPPDLPPDVWQPFIPGRPLSVAAHCATGRAPILFPVAEQRLSPDGRFQYLGGAMPAADVDAAAIHELINRALRSLGEGAVGYLGVDVLVPDDGSPPLAVEINPRLTTSYLGYRALCRDNLAQTLLEGREPQWRTDVRIEFDSDGRTQACLDPLYSAQGRW